MALDDTFGDVLDVVYKIEKALYSLYKAISSDDYKNIVSKVPAVVTSTIQNALKPIIEKVMEVVKQFQDMDIMNKVQSVLTSGLDVVHSTMDLLPASVQDFATKAERFLRVVVGFVTAGVDHITAIIDLLGQVVLGLVGSAASLKQTTLDVLTKKNPQLAAATH